MGHLPPDETTYTPDALLTVKLKMWNSGERARLLLDAGDSTESKLDHAIERLMQDVARIANQAALNGHTSLEDDDGSRIEKGIEEVLNATRNVRRNLQRNCLKHFSKER